MNSSNDILQAILVARRLLSEHVDVLQLVKDDAFSKQPHSVVSPKVTSMIRSAFLAAASAAAVAACVQRTLTLNGRPTTALCATLASTACTVYATQNLRRQLQHRTQLRNVARLLRTVDSFDATLRQKIKYFREALCLLGNNYKNASDNSGAQHRLAKLSADATAAVSTAMPVIWATYAAIQRLEMLPLTDEWADVYLPTESLDNCELLTTPTGECSANKIRELQEIFQFLQSQLLVRLGLATVYNAAEAVLFIGDDLPRLCGTIDAQLGVFADQRRDLAQRQKMERKLEAIKCTHPTVEWSALGGLKHASTDVLGRMLALCEEYGFVDAEMQSALDVHDVGVLSVGVNMERFGERLDLCVDEFRRFVCTYQRAVHGRMEPIVNAVTAQAAEAAPVVRSFDDAPAAAPEAEFYALAETDDDDFEEANSGDEKDSPANAAQSIDDELKELSTKIVKRQFRPVLRQLKDRLEPINEAMRKRERKFFEEKGIAVEADGGQLLDNEEEDEIDDEDSVAKPARKDPYADMRQFLQDKQPMSFMPPRGFPMHRALDEEVLE